MHQGIGLEGLNALEPKSAVSALFECCHCVVLAERLAKARPYASRSDLFSLADHELFRVDEETIGQMVASHLGVGSRPRSKASEGEQCAIWDPDHAVMSRLHAAVGQYEAHFNRPFLIYAGELSAAEVIDVANQRLDNDQETEDKVIRNELAKVHRHRLERMLGPEGGYPLW
jgi:2-oxo-4-hydroxy-4-carboxy-5-ureidoimidazoline decarboxylase